METEYKDYSQETRNIYHSQHKKVGEDRKAMERFINMFTLEYFGLGEDYFQGKKVLDAGCGNTGKILIPLARFGAAEVHGCDIGSDFIPLMKASLLRYGVDEGKIFLRPGNATRLPYEDNSFDFVSCHGVVTCMNNEDEVWQAMQELVRVTKPGGHTYIVFSQHGGLLKDAILPAVREYYRTNSEFKHFIDTIEPKVLHDTFDYIEENIEKHTGERVDLKLAKELFDVDYTVMLQNLIQPQNALKISESFIRDHYERLPVTDIRRLRRYVKRANIRKYTAPLHYDTTQPVSRILYGDGNMEFLVKKIEK